MRIFSFQFVFAFDWYISSFLIYREVFIYNTIGVEAVFSCPWPVFLLGCASSKLRCIPSSPPGYWCLSQHWGKFMDLLMILLFPTWLPLVKIQVFVFCIDKNVKSTESPVSHSSQMMLRHVWSPITASRIRLAWVCCLLIASRVLACIF